MSAPPTEPAKYDPDHSLREDAVEASNQPGDRHRGRDVHQQVNVLGLAVELGQLGPEVRAHVPHDLLDAVQVPRGEHPVPGDEHQVGVQDEHAVPASTNVLY